MSIKLYMSFVVLNAFKICCRFQHFFFCSSKLLKFGIITKFKVQNYENVKTWKRKISRCFKVSFINKSRVIIFFPHNG